MPEILTKRRILANQLNTLLTDDPIGLNNAMMLLALVIREMKDNDRFWAIVEGFLKGERAT